MDRSTARMLAKEAEAALADVAKKHGLTVRQERGTIGSGYLTIKYSFTEPRSDGLPSGKEASAFIGYAGRGGHGLTRAALGATFIARGQKMRIIGYSPRSPKNPFCLKDVHTGKRYKAPLGFIKLHLAASLIAAK